MVQDLSYLAEQPSEAQEEAVKKAVEQECIRTLVTYLTEVANAMDTNSIQSINSADLRAMAAQFTERLKELTDGQNENG
jgi:uncharacterized phage infection (PIP) family protein YhgE